MIVGAPALPPAPAAEALVTLAAGVPASTLGVASRPLVAGSRTYVVSLDGRSIDAVRALPGVVAAEPNRRRHVAAVADPLAARQGHLAQIAWAAQAGTRRPLVAVLDTGVDARHPDLRGVVDLVDSKTFVGGSSLVDSSGHGTHVAGIIAAVNGNGIGGTGIGKARILSVKIADATGDTDTASIVAGIRYATEQQAAVINISLSGAEPSELERAAIADAVRAGVVVVAAAGNSGRTGNSAEYPAAYPHVIGVGAVRGDGKSLLDSTQGPQVLLAAPGKGIWSTSLRRGYRTRTGTSMAAAIVSGAAARLLAKRPGLRPDQVAEILRRSADDTGPRGRDDATGAGVLNLADALSAGTPPRDRKVEPDDDPALIAANPPVLPAGQYAGQGIGTLRQWFDPADDYRVPLQAGQRIAVSVQADPGLDPDVVIWKPGAPAFVPGPQYTRDWLAAASIGAGETESLVFTAPTTGDYTLELRAGRGGARYVMTVRRDDIPPP